MNKNKEIGYSKAEKEARDLAISKGLPIPESYVLPYSLEDMTKYAAIDQNWPVHKMTFEDLNGVHEYKDLPKIFYRVVFQGDIPMGGWFADKKLARKDMEMYNIRHFAVMGNSENKNKPVLI